MFVSPLYDYLEPTNSVDADIKLPPIVTCQYCSQSFHASDIQSHILAVHAKDSRKAAFRSSCATKSEQIDNMNFSATRLYDVPEQNRSLLKGALLDDLSNPKPLLIPPENQSLTENGKTAVESEVNAFNACMDFINNDKNFQNIFEEMHLDQTDNLLPFMIPPDQQIFPNSNVADELLTSDLNNFTLQNAVCKKNDTSVIHKNNFQFENDATFAYKQPNYLAVEKQNSIPTISNQKFIASTDQNIEKNSSPKNVASFTELAEMIKASLLDGGTTEIETETLKDHYQNEKTHSLNNSSPKNVIQNDCNVNVHQDANKIDCNFEKGDDGNNLSTDHATDIKTNALTHKVKLKCGYCKKLLSSTTCLKNHSAKFHINSAISYTKVIVTEKKIDRSAVTAIPTDSFSTNINLNSKHIMSPTDAKKNKYKVKKEAQNESSLSKGILNNTKACKLKGEKTECEVCGKILTVNYLKYHMKNKHADTQSKESKDVFQSVQDNELETNISSDSKCKDLNKTPVLDSTSFTVPAVPEQDIDSSTCLSASDALQRNISYNVTDESIVSNISNKLAKSSSVKFNFNNIEFSKGSQANENNSAKNSANIEMLTETKSDAKLIENEISSKLNKKHSCGSKTVICSICNKTLSHRGNLNRHLKTTHKMEPSKIKLMMEPFENKLENKLSEHDFIIQNKSNPEANSQITEQPILSKALSENSKHESSELCLKRKSGRLKAERGNLLKSVLHSNFISKQFQSKELSTASDKASSVVNAENRLSSNIDPKLCDDQLIPKIPDYHESDKLLDLNAQRNKSEVMLSSNVSEHQTMDVLEQHKVSLENNNSQEKDSLCKVDMSLNPLQSHASESNIVKAEVENSSVVMPISEIISNVSKCNFGTIDAVKEEIDDNSLKLSIPSPEILKNNTLFSSHPFEFCETDVTCPKLVKNIESPKLSQSSSMEIPKGSLSTADSVNDVFCFKEECSENTSFSENSPKTVPLKSNTSVNFSYSSENPLDLHLSPKISQDKIFEVAPQENVYCKKIKNMIEDTVELYFKGSLQGKQGVFPDFDKSSPNEKSVSTNFGSRETINDKNKVSHLINENSPFCTFDKIKIENSKNKCEQISAEDAKVSNNVSERRFNVAFNDECKTTYSSSIAENKNSSSNIEECKSKISYNAAYTNEVNDNLKNEIDISEDILKDKISVPFEIPKNKKLDNVADASTKSWNSCPNYDVYNGMVKSESNISIEITEAEPSVLNDISKNSFCVFKNEIQKPVILNDTKKSKIQSSLSNHITKNEVIASKSITENQVNLLKDLDESKITGSKDITKNSPCILTDIFENEISAVKDSLENEPATLNDLNENKSLSKDIADLSVEKMEEAALKNWNNASRSNSDKSQNSLANDSSLFLPDKSDFLNEVATPVISVSNAIQDTVKCVSPDVKKIEDSEPNNIIKIEIDTSGVECKYNSVPNYRKSGALNDNDNKDQIMSKKEIDLVVENQIFDKLNNFRKTGNLNQETSRLDDVSNNFDDGRMVKKMKFDCSNSVAWKFKNNCFGSEEILNSSKLINSPFHNSKTDEASYNDYAIAKIASDDAISKKNICTEICQLCEKKFSSLDLLLKHLKSIHKDPLINQTVDNSAGNINLRPTNTSAQLSEVPLLKLDSTKLDSDTRFESNISVKCASSDTKKTLKEIPDLVPYVEPHKVASSIDTCLETKNIVKNTIADIQPKKLNSFNHFHASASHKRHWTEKSKQKFRRHTFCDSKLKNAKKWCSSSARNKKLSSIRHNRTKIALQKKGVSLPNCQIAQYPMTTFHHQMHRRYVRRKRTKTDCFCCSKNKPLKLIKENKCTSCRKRGRPRKVSIKNSCTLTLKSAEICSFLESHPQPRVRLTKLEDSVSNVFKISPSKVKIKKKSPIKKAVVKLERLELSSDPDNSLDSDQTCSQKLDFFNAIPLKPELNDDSTLFTQNCLYLRSNSPEILFTSTVLKKSDPIIIDLTDSNSRNSSTLKTQNEESLKCPVEIKKNSDELLSKSCRVVLKRVLM